MHEHQIDQLVISDCQVFAWKIIIGGEHGQYQNEKKIFFFFKIKFIQIFLTQNAVAWHQ